jgi:DNA-binding XRE family transcriptional regulator
MDLGELGARIKKRREARGLRQADLASALRVTPQAVSKWERGENAPDIVVLVPLSRLLDVSVEWLLGGSPIERETFEAVVMVTGVGGYAKRSQVESPRALAAWINGLHHTVTETMRHFDGVPVKYVGDGALGFFSGPGLGERAARRCACVTSWTTWRWRCTAGRSTWGASGTTTTQRSTSSAPR